MGALSAVTSLDRSSSSSFENVFFKNVQSYIDKNDYEQALKYLIPSYDRQVDQEFVKKIYFCLHKIVPNLNKLSNQLNLENLFNCLDNFPDLTSEQCQFALDLAKTYQRSNNFYKAMSLISKAIIIAEKYSLNNINELYSLAHEVFLKSIEDILHSKKEAVKNNLNNALIDNNVKNFNSALLEIKSLEPYLCNFEFTREILISLYTYAHNILTDYSWGNKETKQDFAKQFDERIIIEKVKLQDFILDISENNFLKKARKDLIDFRKKLEARFKQIDSIKDYRSIRDLQEKVKKDFIEFFRKNIIEHATSILEHPPCDFDIRAMGSIARAEICTYSDLEFIILIEDEKHIDYFKKIVSIMELIIVSLGETAEKDFVFSCLGVKNKSGFHIDSGANPKNSDLIKTPEGMAEFCLQKEDRDFLLFSLRNTSSLTYENTPSNLFDVFQKELNQGKNNPTLQMQFFNRLQKRLDDYKKFDTNINNLKIVNVKNQFTQLINYILLELAIFYKIDLNNPIDIIDSLKELNIFTMNSAILLKEVVSSVYMTRTRLHFLYEEQKEEALLPNQVFISDNFYFLNKEYDQLLSAYWLVLKPLYKIVKEFIKKSKDNKVTEKLIEQPKDNSLKDIDFLNLAFDIEISNFNEKKDKESNFLFIKTFVKKLIEFNLLKEELPVYYEKLHEGYYKKLSLSSSFEDLRKIYLNTLYAEERSLCATEFFLKFANIPNVDGFRQIKRIESENLQKTCFAISTGTLKDGETTIVIITPWMKQYLKKEIIDQILDENGDIKKGYSNSAHLVARAKGKDYDLHFKQLPAFPVMEYAIYDLMYRTVGKAAPANILCRFEVQTPKIKKIYPVLISETIQGQSLAEYNSLKDLDQKHLTWLLIGAILTRPGDGRISNYIVDEKKRVFCIDNDVSFVESIVYEKSFLFSQKKVNFKSILFCLDPKPLDKNVIEEFNELNPVLIINRWLDELIKKEKEYQELFSDEEIKKFWGDSKPFALFKAGTVVSMLMQFNQLKEFFQKKIEKKEEIYPLDLLGQLITFTKNNFGQSLIGPDIKKAYSNQDLKITPRERLQKALDQKIDQSLSTAQASLATLQKIPDFDEVKNREEFSPKMAKEEIAYFEINKGSNVFWENDKLIVDFKKMKKDENPNRDRQKSVIDMLNLILSKENVKKPLYVSLTNCDVLNLENLNVFLHENLIELDLHNCPRVNDSIVRKIINKCNNLKKLNLSHCKNIIGRERYHNSRPGFETLHLRIEKFSLENLDISYCFNLEYLNINCHNLKELKANDNINLNDVIIDIPITCKVNFSNCDKVIAEPPDCLLNNNYFVNCKDSKGNTPLICAAKTGQINKFKELINRNVDINVNIQDKEGKTALMYALHNFSLFNSIIKLAINRTEVMDKITSIKLLIDRTDVNIRDNDGKTALMYALVHRWGDVIIKLLADRTNIEIQDNEGKTALMYAILWSWFNHLTVRLFNSCCAINKQDNDGKTALIHAIEVYSHFSIFDDAHLRNIKFLIEEAPHINVDIQDKNGKTALIYAANHFAKLSRIIELLINKGVNVNIQDKEGKTALMYAIKYYSHYSIFAQMDKVKETIELLINQSNVNIQDKEGKTVLMYAVEVYYSSSTSCSEHYIELLINKSDVNIQDNEGKTALMLAKDAGKKEMTELLLKKIPNE